MITANVAAGPNGGASTADEVTLTSANSGLYYQTNVSGTYTFSVWVKLVSGNGDFAPELLQRLDQPQRSRKPWWPPAPGSGSA